MKRAAKEVWDMNYKVFLLVFALIVCSASVFAATTVDASGSFSYNLSIVSASISGRSDGIRNYTLRVQVDATDSLTGLGNSSGNATVINISIDNTAPTFALLSPVNGTNRNGNASVVTNTSMTQKLHKWRVQCVDAFGIGANSSIRDLTIDAGVPTNANVTLSLSSVKYGSSVTLTCSSADAISNTTNVTLSVQPVGLSSFRHVANSTTNNVSFLFEETRELGTYNVNCTAQDYTGNQNSSVLAFDVVTAASSQKTPLSVIRRGQD